MAASTDSIVDHVESYVQQELSAMDASHDYAHICRVRNLALSLAKDEHIEDADTLQGIVELQSMRRCV
jgi:hypothetical protein